MTDLRRNLDQGQASPSISVVITSVDRPSLTAAVSSAINQDMPPSEVIIVFDRDDGAVPVELPSDPRITVLHTGTRNGAAAARQLGAEHATGQLIGFLDDDDEWRADKLRLQVGKLQELNDGGRHVVVSCRADMRWEWGDSHGVEPRQEYEEGADVADYLFVRHSVLSGGFGLASSTLLCDAPLLKEVPWSADLRLHEDWDWVLRATRAGARLSIVPEPLVTYRLQPPTAAASRPPGGWNDSAAWARSIGMSPAALGDFLLCVSAVNAASYGERRAALSLARAAAREGRPSARGWVAFLIQLLLPARIVRSAGKVARRTSSWMRRERRTAVE